MAFNTITAQFLTKKRLKMKRLLQRHHQIEDLSYIDRINKEPTFSGAEEDEEEEEREKVE